MTVQAAIVFGILIITIILFVSEKLRLDLVAILSMLALTVTGILSPQEALSGFAEPVVIIIAALFIVGEGLFQTGVAQAMGRIPARIAGNSEVKLIAIIMLAVAVLSGFMSSTGTVAVMLPVVMGIALSRKISPSKLLIPVSVASLLGGMLTLIGTPPNIVVSSTLQNMGREPFSFFSFTPIGLVVLVVGIVFMLVIGRKMLPDRPGPASETSGKERISTRELAESYELDSTLFSVRIPEESSLVGSTLAEINLSNRFCLTVVDLKEAVEDKSFVSDVLKKNVKLKTIPALAETRLKSGHVLTLQGNHDSIARLVTQEEFALIDPPHDKKKNDNNIEKDLVGSEMGMAEVLLTPRSRFSGKTLKEIMFRDRFHLSVVGIKRLGQLQKGDIRKLVLKFGDTLLVQGSWKNIHLLEKEHRDVVVALPPEEAIAGKPYNRAPIALFIMVAMMVIMTAGWLPVVTSVLLAAVCMILFRCVRVEDAYRCINWQSVVLIAGIIPMATALDKSGGMNLIVSSMSSLLINSGPLMLLAALFILTSLLSQVISNTATAVLVAPIAFQLAESIDAAPEPFMMAIAIAASTAFATPMASPVNTLVLGPGGYRFNDFLKIGLTLQVLVFFVAILVIPLLFPF